ncbi:MAG TPA: hypothetical protein VHO70_10145 [Chitinispirillaceae bacterium]|nr:hypothetical protein [Chitinispirillaceae bacterium]
MINNRNFPATSVQKMTVPVIHTVNPILFLNILLIVVFSMFTGCGRVEPADPTGIAVWADDCSEIACAINKADWDGRLFMNHETNERYDVALYDDKGIHLKTIVSDRTIDGFASSVEEIYYMKTKGYILIKTLMYNCGGRRWERISSDGKITTMHHIACDNALDQVKMLSSPNGTFIIMALLSGSDVAKKNCEITFYDSTGTNVISKTEQFQTSSVPVIRWLTDSLLQIRSSSYSSQFKIVGPSAVVRDSTGSQCDLPLTSSSAYCPGKGYITFIGSSQTINFSATVPQYLHWCGVNEHTNDTMPIVRNGTK